MGMLEDLKRKYEKVFQVIDTEHVRLENVHIENNKLLVRGEAPSQQAKDRVWDQTKAINPAYHDITVDIRVAAGGAAPAPAPAVGADTYTVKAGDTLSKIAKQFYGDANKYPVIFDANRDKLKDPDKISPGQKLVIPPKAS